MRIARTPLVPIALALLALSACSEEDLGGSDCNAEIDRMIGQRGAPDDVDSYSSSDGNVFETLWWWNQGVSVTYKNGPAYTNCEQDVFRFAPI